MCYGGRRNSLDPGRTTRVWNYTYFVNDRTQGRQEVCCRSVTNKKVERRVDLVFFHPISAHTLRPRFGVLPRLRSGVTPKHSSHQNPLYRSAGRLRLLSRVKRGFTKTVEPRSSYTKIKLTPSVRFNMFSEGMVPRGTYYSCNVL